MWGIIGGTGLYSLPGLELLEEIELHTPFASLPVNLKKGRYSGREVFFLPRHGTRHCLAPHEINYRANIWALKAAGVTKILSVSAVGSLQESLPPGSIIVPDQFIDFTRGVRAKTFFGDGIVAHISSAEPVSKVVMQAIGEASKGDTLQLGGTYICVEGPRLGTKAESLMLRRLGGDVVGMTNVPEVFLAREAQISYASICVATDYDCWRDDPSDFVSIDELLKVYRDNIVRVQSILGSIMEQTVDDSSCPARSALTGSILTPLENVSPEKREMLEVLLR